MSLKEFFFKTPFLYSFFSVRFLMKMAKKNKIAIFYHFIKDDKEDLTKYLYKAKNKTQFIEDLFFLKKHFTSISVVDYVNNTKKEELNFFLSFDDGLANFYDVVAPILIKEKVHAINFLNSNFIDNKCLFYRYKINILVSFIIEEKLSKAQKNTFCKELEFFDFEKEKVVNQLKKLTILDVQKIDELLNICHFSTDDYLNQQQPYLTKEHIIELEKKGFQFGSHSENHPRYIHLSLENQIKETIKSIQKVNEIAKTNYFAFPFSDDGVSKEFFQKMASENIITFGSSGLKDEDFENHYQRIPMEYNSIYSAETIVKGELFYYLLKKLLGKNKRKMD